MGLVEGIETTRLLLREVRWEDLDPLHAYCSDERLVFFLSWKANTYEKTRDYVERCLQHQENRPRYNYELVAERREDGCIIGHCQLHLVRKRPQAKMEVFVARREWGHGYGTEVICALLAIAFGPLGLHRVYAEVPPADTITARVAEKCGMKREGHLREHTWAKGEWHDSLVYAILDYEYEQALRKTQQQAPCILAPEKLEALFNWN